MARKPEYCFGHVSDEKKDENQDKEHRYDLPHDISQGYSADRHADVKRQAHWWMDEPYHEVKNNHQSKMGEINPQLMNQREQNWN